jgi:hypothetical protein
MYHPNDVKDWANKSGEMASVYKGATLTISASRSKSATEGFLRPREPKWQENYLLETVKPLGFKYYTLSKRAPDHFRRYLDCGPLKRRAWCLQESLLSRRVVDYAENGNMGVQHVNYWREATPRDPMEANSMGALRFSNRIMVSCSRRILPTRSHGGFRQAACVVWSCSKFP